MPTQRRREGGRWVESEAPTTMSETEYRGFQPVSTAVDKEYYRKTGRVRQIVPGRAAGPEGQQAGLQLDDPQANPNLREGEDGGLEALDQSEHPTQQAGEDLGPGSELDEEGKPREDIAEARAKVRRP